MHCSRQQTIARIRREIGSEFWEVPTCLETHELFPAKAEWFVSGRSALTGVLEDAMRSKSIRSAALPSWCCESMAIPFHAKNIEVQYYPVSYRNGTLSQDIAESLGCDLMLIMGYFGMSDAPEVPSEYKGVVVEDITHSLFNVMCNNRVDYRFGSLRKWCGLATGGFAWNANQQMYVSKASVNERYVGMRRRAMRAKAAYICNSSTDKGYLSVFSCAEKWLDGHVQAMAADQDDIKAAVHLDVVNIREARQRNARLLLDELKAINGINLLFSDLREDDCPLFIPVIVEERDSLREYLIANEVYCPVHWPAFGLRSLDGLESAFYKHGLSLVCDQRYDYEDMIRIVELVKQWQKIS